MECIQVKNLSFSYPNSQIPVLKSINLTVNQGEFALVCGKSGCGKTTLLRLLKPTLSPHGEMHGNISVFGIPFSDYTAKEQAANIGFVMQNPENQIVTDKVWHELSFGLESLGFKQNEIRARVSEMASYFGIQTWFHKNVSELSGGQKQLLSLASVMVLQPSVLILDEPTAQLDPIAAGEFLKTLEKINRELGITVILTEHRLEDVFPMADRVIVMDGGEIIANGAPAAVGQILKSTDHEMYFALPTPMRVHSAVKNPLPCPLTVRDGRAWLDAYTKEHALNPSAIPKAAPATHDPVIEIREAYFRYEKNLPDVIKGLNLTVNKGELFCMVGGNGTGKTTALSLISGLNTPYRGEVLLKGKRISKIKNLYSGLLGVLPQDPQSVFVEKTVALDLAESLHPNAEAIQNIACLCRIESLLDRHPYDLSGGEQERAALAKVLLSEPEILLLDEPTKGMDAQFKSEFAEILANLKASGVTIVMVSHDLEFCAEYADRCALFFDGSITSVDTPRDFFKGKSFYTTSANRMARTHLPDAVLAEDLIRACGGFVKKRTPKPRDTHHAKHKPQKTEAARPKTDQGLTKRALLAFALILFLIPLTICIGNHFFGNRKYYFISLLILLETMLPFCMVFEARKPKARELVIISVLCALAVASRAAFFMLPQFKPVVALVILSGVCFGGETGFLVGAVTGFVSNFFFGQGPWAPWQMFSFGIIGFLAGTLFQKGLLKQTKPSLCIFGALSTFFIYGGIMNPASVIMWQSTITWEMIVSACVAGIPFDLVHAASTAVFLWLLSEPMLEKLKRIKVKHGLL